MYALTTTTGVDAVGSLPRTARRLDTGQWVTPPPDGWTDALAAACGWLPVVESPRPADTATTTWDAPPSAYVREGAGWRQVWVERPWTGDELTARTQQATATRDRTDATDLASKVAADIGLKLTGSETWPTVKTWRTLNAVKAGELTTTADLARIIVWLVPACLRTARLARKAYRLASGDTTDDTSTD